MIKEETEEVTTTVKLPHKIVEIFEGEARYRCAYGGRGSAKTRSFALMTAVRGYTWAMEGKQGQILCAREHLNSLDESSLEEVKSAIRSVDFLSDFYELGEKYIRSKCGRINYVFAGLRRNLDSIKSKARIILCWVDEAEGVSDTAWQKLIPTVREDNSEIWVTWNPETKHSATHRRFRLHPPQDMKIAEINWRDNPYFPDVLEKERQQDKINRPDLYDHIWEGEMLIHAEGAYYAVEMREATHNERMTNVPYDSSIGVITAWDLGMGDSTSIWFAQMVGAEVRLIDYYESSGVGLDHYARVLNEKGYIYDQHILPHDVRVRELGSGRSRLETLDSLGVRPVQIAPQLNVDDGIQAVRSMLGRCWFDAEKCERGIDALRQYRREYDEKGMTWRSRPLHDWTSHCADAMRYLAIGYRPTSNWGEPIRRNLQGIV
jgi:phage terminase large subunit